MSLNNNVEQSVQLQEELNATAGVGNSQGGLAIRTDLRAGVCEDIMSQLQGDWQSLIDQFSLAGPAGAIGPA